MPVPNSTAFCCGFFSFFHGVLVEKPNSSPTASSTRPKYSPRYPLHGAIAPSSIDRSSSPMTSSGSTSKRVPRPSHRSHAPYGELNEKLRGASSSKLSPQCEHARCSENVRTSRSSSVLLRVGAGQARLALGLVVAADDLDLGHTLGEAQRGLERVGEAALDAGPAHEPVDDHLDGVVLVARQPLLLAVVELHHLAVDPGAGEALPGELVEQAVVLALAAAHDRREHLEAGALGQLEHAVDDLLGRLARDHAAAVRAVRDADPRVQQAQVVVDLGDRADGRPRVAARRLLVDRDRGRQALDEVDVGLVHLPEELARVAAQALDVAALALGVDRVEREAALAAARQSGDDDEPVARQVDVDVAQVVFARAADRDDVRLAGRDRLRCPRRSGGAGHGRRNRARGRLLPVRRRPSPERLRGGLRRRLGAPSRSCAVASRRPSSPPLAVFFAAGRAGADCATFFAALRSAMAAPYPREARNERMFPARSRSPSGGPDRVLRCPHARPRTRTPFPSPDTVVVTDAGLETWLVFDHGVDLPGVRRVSARRDRRRPWRSSPSTTSTTSRIADGIGAACLLEAPTWRANPDWAATLGHDRARARGADRGRGRGARRRSGAAGPVRSRSSSAVRSVRVATATGSTTR